MSPRESSAKTPPIEIASKPSICYNCNLPIKVGDKIRHVQDVDVHAACWMAPRGGRK